MGPPMTPTKFGVNIFSRFLSMHSKWYSQIFVLAPFSEFMLSIPEKFIMMRSEEMDSAHMVHKGGANPPSCLMHHSVSWTKYTAKPAKKTRKSWHTEKYKQIEMTNEL